jgi:hypothetical protein
VEYAIIILLVTILNMMGTQAPVGAVTLLVAAVVVLLLIMGEVIGGQSLAVMEQLE